MFGLRWLSVVEPFHVEQTHGRRHDDGFTSYDRDNCSDTRTWNAEIGWLGLPPIQASIAYGRLNTILPTLVRAGQHPADDLPDGDLSHHRCWHGGCDTAWHDPLRVDAQASVLDYLSKGSFRFGMGRGLARRDFMGLRLSMDESHGRFDEAASRIFNALKTGFMEDRLIV